MGRRNDDIDWKSVFLSYFSHDASSDSAATRASGVAMAASSDDDERRRGSPGLHQRSEEPRSELERRFGKCCRPGAQVDGGAQAQHCRVTRAAAKVRNATHACSLLCSCHGDELWCLYYLCAFCCSFYFCAYVLRRFCSRSLALSISFSEYNFSLGLQAAVGLGPDVSSASNVVYDLSKIPSYACCRYRFFNLARLRVVLKVDWENLGSSNGVLNLSRTAGMHAIPVRVEYQSK